jgi:hypothetical protein
MNANPALAIDQGIPTMKYETAIAIAARMSPADIQIAIHHDIF